MPAYNKNCKNNLKKLSVMFVHIFNSTKVQASWTCVQTAFVNLQVSLQKLSFFFF